jgi:hypothetical protein
MLSSYRLTRARTALSVTGSIERASGERGTPPAIPAHVLQAVSGRIALSYSGRDCALGILQRCATDRLWVEGRRIRTTGGGFAFYVVSVDECRQVAEVRRGAWVDAGSIIQGSPWAGGFAP